MHLPNAAGVLDKVDFARYQQKLVIVSSKGFFLLKKKSRVTLLDFVELVTFPLCFKTYSTRV